MLRASDCCLLTEIARVEPSDSVCREGPPFQQTCSAIGRDVTDSFRVIVSHEVVGERCELMHEVFLLDLGIDLTEVVSELVSRN